MRRHLRLSLHAAVRCGADDWQALEQLCCYITRPALANERVQTYAAGQVVLKLKTPWRDGTTHLVISPMEPGNEYIDGRFVAARFTIYMSAMGRPLPAADVSYPVAQVGWRLSGDEIARLTGANRPKGARGGFLGERPVYLGT